MELLALLQIVVQERQQEQLQHVQRHSRWLETEQKRLEGQADAGRTMLHGGYIQPSMVGHSAQHGGYIQPKNSLSSPMATDPALFRT